MILLPLISLLCSFIACGTFIGRLIGHRGAVVISIYCLLSATISSLILWVETCWGGSESWLDLGGVWFEVGSFQIGWKLSGDLLSSHMMLTVTSVSLAVHLYAAIYMRSDPHLNLFISYLSLFTFFMLVLVTADNLVLMLVGWEGIGVCSYLLIGYWSQRLSAIKSAGKAILVNRVSDGVLMWGIVWIWHHTGAIEYDLVLMASSGGSYIPAASQDPSWVLQGHSSSTSVATAPSAEFAYQSLYYVPSNLMLLSILVGAMGKSAQILFHVWLAEAMEGPTPVSALIHAATLVTAGVYLMVRLAPFWDDLVLIVGSLTALMAGVFGYFQSDLKRVIAFSTCSQLGYMMVSVGLGEHGAEASLSHLMTHASFKAALFLAAGLLIGVSGGQQHTARYGALSGVHTSLFTFMTLVLASLSLVGWPELSGFYSKETIINLSYGASSALSDVAHTLMLLTAFLTSCYSAKLLYQGFVMDYSGRPFGGFPVRATDKSLSSSTSNPKQMLNVLVSLMPSLAMTILLLDILIKVWIGTNLLSGIVWFVPWGVKTLPFGLVIAGILSAMAGTAVWMNSMTLVRFCGTRWGFDQVYARLLVNATLDWGRLAWCGVTGGLSHSPRA